MLFSVQITMAHGPIHEKIEKVTKQIKRHPEDADLYIERAGYYKIDDDFDKSFADYQMARILNPNLTTIDFLLAELFHEFNYNHSALVCIKSFEKLKINQAEALQLKASIFHKLSSPDSALHYAKAAYPHITKARTHFFLSIKDYVLAADSTNYADAMRWLKTGKERLPFDMVVQEVMVDLALQFGDLNTAKQHCEEQIPHLKRQEYWYFKLADVNLKMGDKVSALNNLNSSLNCINQLSRHHRNTSYIKSLIQQIEKRLNELNKHD